MPLQTNATRRPASLPTTDAARRKARGCGLVIPDQVVAPLGGAAGTEHVEGHLALLGALVHGLDGLEGELHPQGGGAFAACVVFALPG